MKTPLVGPQVRLSKETTVTRTSRCKCGEPIPGGAESVTIARYLPCIPIGGAAKRPMVEMMLPYVLESAFKTSTRKSAALLKAASEPPDLQDANEHREKGLPSHSKLLRRLRAVGIADAGLHFMVLAPLRSVSPQLEIFESILHGLLHRHADSDQRRT